MELLEMVYLRQNRLLSESQSCNTVESWLTVRVRWTIYWTLIPHFLRGTLSSHSRISRTRHTGTHVMYLSNLFTYIILIFWSINDPILFTIYNHATNIFNLNSPYIIFVHIYTYCRIDATVDDGRLGRLCNHAHYKEANAHAEYIEVDGKPAIILVATKKIKINDEIRYDYGETDQKTRSIFPFLSAGLWYCTPKTQ